MAIHTSIPQQFFKIVQAATGDTIRGNLTKPEADFIYNQIQKGLYETRADLGGAIVIMKQ